MVIVVGSDTTLEREGLDRRSIEISTAQTKLIAAVASAAKLPLVVVRKRLKILLINFS